jgi:hypothetical protein
MILTLLVVLFIAWKSTRSLDPQNLTMADEQTTKLEPAPTVETVETQVWTGTPSIDSWGFIVYRTVYSKESDEKWPRVLEMLPRYILAGIEDSVSLQPAEEWNFLQVTRENPQLFSGAGPEVLREHFNNNSQRRLIIAPMKQSIFFVIDEESLLTFDEAPDDPKDQVDSVTHPYFTRPYFTVYDAEFVNGQYDSEEDMTRGEEPGDDGTMKITVRVLRHFVRGYFALSRRFLRFVTFRVYLSQYSDTEQIEYL